MKKHLLTLSICSFVLSCGHNSKSTKEPDKLPTPEIPPADWHPVGRILTPEQGKELCTTKNWVWDEDINFCTVKPKIKNLKIKNYDRYTLSLTTQPKPNTYYFCSDYTAQLFVIKKATLTVVRNCVIKLIKRVWGIPEVYSAYVDLGTDFHDEIKTVDGKHYQEIYTDWEGYND